MELADSIRTMHDSSYNSTATWTAPNRAAPELSIGELTEVICGELSLGTMPPLGGFAEPIGNIVTDSRQVQPGDLFWGLPGKAYNGAHFAEEAILRGAQGTVVAGRHIEPWGGRFSIRVPDTRQALAELGQWARQQFQGTVIAVADGPEQTATCALLDQLLRSRWQGTCDLGLPRDVTASALAMLRWPRRNDYAIIEMTARNEQQFPAISTLCDPQIVAITDLQKTTHHKSMTDLAAFAEYLAGLLDAISPDAVVVMHGDDPDLRNAARNRSTKILWVGRGSDCDVVATRICYRDGQLALNVDHHRYVFPATGRHDWVAALSAIAIEKLLSVSPVDRQATAEKLRQNAGRCQVTATAGVTRMDDPFEVPSSVSALREVGATLPPGLEQYAR